MDNRTFYAVSSGSYSDFRYLFAYDNEADAQAAVAAGHGDDYHELAVLPAGTLPTKVRVWTGRIDRDGQPWYSDKEVYPWAAPAPVKTVVIPPPSVRPGGMIHYIYGTDREAVAAATEQWAEDRRREAAKRG